MLLPIFTVELNAAEPTVPTLTVFVSSWEPTVTILLVVSTLTSALPAAFWTWKAVAEFAIFLNVASPLLLRVSTLVGAPDTVRYTPSLPCN